MCVVHTHIYTCTICAYIHVMYVHIYVCSTHTDIQHSCTRVHTGVQTTTINNCFGQKSKLINYQNVHQRSASCQRGCPPCLPLPTFVNRPCASRSIILKLESERRTILFSTVVSLVLQDSNGIFAIFLFFLFQPIKNIDFWPGFIVHRRKLAFCPVFFSHFRVQTMIKHVMKFTFGLKTIAILHSCIWGERRSSNR